MTSHEKLSKDELASHRAAAARGEIPSFEIVKKFIATIRKSWNAKPVEKTQGKSRTKKPPPVNEDQIDFF